MSSPMPDRQSLRNPFDNDVVADPATSAPIDVARIHEPAFNVCRKAYERVASGEGSWSVLLYGTAGCGKTHLLSRLRRWLNAELDTSPSQPAALFVAIQMQTGRAMIWRHLRRRFAEELLRPRPNNVTHLGAILDRFSERANGHLSDAFSAAVIQDCSQEITQVLETYAANKHRRLCHAWLKGDRLSDGQLDLLGLSQSQIESFEEDWAEDDARKFVSAIIRLSEPHPVVFCFDQIEALGLSQEKMNYGFFSQMGASLFNTTSNSLMISTINMNFLYDLQSGSRDADFHRIAKDKFDLQPLNFDLARDLINARLKTIPEASNSIDDAKLRPFFQANHGHVTPRALIHEARRLFAEWQGRAMAPAPPLDDFLSTQYERLWNESLIEREPIEIDAVLSHGLPIALQLLGKETKERSEKLIDLSAGSNASTTRIALGNHKNPTSLARWLARMQDLASPNLCIVRDARLGISSTAKATQQRLEAIARAGGRVVRVEAEALAALDAMRRLLATATSGDLSSGGVTIDGSTVRDWLRRNLPKQIVDFAGQLMGGKDVPEPDWQPDALLDLLRDRKVVPLDEAIRLTEVAANKIEAFAKQHPDRICFFSGHQPVVCLAMANSPT
jgi:AAA ATPase domain